MDVGTSVTSLPFALTVILAIVSLTPLTSAGLRRVVLALVNAGFLMLVSRRAALVALGLLLAQWVALQVIARLAERALRWVSGAALLGLLLLFVLNKRPELAVLGPKPLAQALAMIGFSYVFLRAIEQLRHVVESKRAPDLLEHINFLVPFHMLTAGPIQSYAEFLKQPSVPEPLDVDGVLWAIERVVWGLFKKLVLAHFIERLFLTGFTGTPLYSLLEMQFFFLWLYLDFSAYSDIAIGVGRLMGVPTPENFRAPYLARNLVEFWERWHISLSLWIRRNLFTPIQLWLVRRWPEQSPLLSASVAFGVSFLLCGLWHNVSIRYLCWGAMHAAGLVVTNLYRDRLKRRLGAKGLKEYLARPGLRVVATVATYEYVAASLLVIARSGR